jgi:hypothetical protein
MPRRIRACDFGLARIATFGLAAVVGSSLLCASACTSGKPAPGTNTAGGGVDAGATPTAGSTSTSNGGVNGGSAGSDATGIGGDENGGASNASAGGSSGATATSDAGAAPAPTGLLCELTGHPERTLVTDKTPEFSWIVNAARSNERQTAYRILVASSQQKLTAGTGDVWDSGKTASPASVNVAYAGPDLTPNSTYFWQVRSWDSSDTASDWSASQQFTMGARHSVGSSSRSTPRRTARCSM